jgi:hypothetical protein
MQQYRFWTKKLNSLKGKNKIIVPITASGSHAETFRSPEGTEYAVVSSDSPEYKKETGREREDEDDYWIRHSDPAGYEAAAARFLELTDQERTLKELKENGEMLPDFGYEASLLMLLDSEDPDDTPLVKTIRTDLRNYKQIFTYNVYSSDVPKITNMLDHSETPFVIVLDNAPEEFRNYAVTSNELSLGLKTISSSAKRPVFLNLHHIHENGENIHFLSIENDRNYAFTVTLLPEREYSGIKKVKMSEIRGIFK